MMNKQRIIRRATEEDLACVMELIACGRRKMRAMGNLEQWTDGQPRQEVVEQDISEGNCYVVEDSGVAVASFAFAEGPEDAYAEIYEGQWVDDHRPYHVIHRIASAPGVHGILRAVFAYCFARAVNIRIDTHRQNTTMRTVLPKYGFRYCGIVYLSDGADRLAYQRCLL